MKLLRNILLVVASFFVYFADAQVFNEGRESASVKYEVLKAPSYRLIYPIEYRSEAFKLSYFIDTVAPYISYGMKRPYYSFPVILYTSEQYSNGLVSLLPSRADLYVTPSVSMTSTPWNKQLTIHEYRHVAQMAALRTGVLNGARYAIGELAGAVGLAVVPKWLLEGDATNAETQLAEYGRGLQPSFSIEYRAMMTDEAKKPFNKFYIDNLILGSYNYHIPDYYKFGYNIMRSYETHIGDTFAGNFFDYAGRKPFVISPIFFTTRKYGYKNVKRFAIMTFAKLDSLWRPLSSGQNNYNYISNSERSYTVYKYPIPIEGNKFVALKNSMDSPAHFVIHDGANETNIGYTGTISSRPVVKDGVVYWTEYKRDLFYDLKSSSVIRSFSLSNSYRKSFRRDVNSYLLTPVKDGWATVRYDSLIHAHIIIHDSMFADIDTISFQDPTSIHGLAYDKSTDKLYYIAVDDYGMRIGSHGLSSNDKHEVIRMPSAVTLSDLSASNGKLYFGSIQSGKDEIHMIDLKSGCEFQLTKSRLGAREPVPMGEDSVMFTGYSVDGWNVATLSNEEVDSMEMHWQRLPDDILNPDYVKWSKAKSFDSLRLDTVAPPERKIKRYRRASGWFTFHSWIPGLAGDVDEVLSHYSGRIGFGATGMFQSPLGDCQGFATVGSREGKFWTIGKIDYSGLPVVFSLKGEYGGDYTKVYIPNVKNYDVEKYGELGYARDVVVSASLPMNLSSYSATRTLKPSISFIQSGDMIYDEDDDSFVTGLGKWEASLYYASVKSYSTRCLSPRLGIAVKVGIQGALHADFSQIYYLTTSFYLPGLLKNHSFLFTGSAQYQRMGDYGLFAKTNVPTGIIDNNVYQKYHYVSGTYKLPICYPDWGLDRFIYCKRIFAEVFGEYSLGIFPTEIGYPNINNFSYGFTLGLDVSTLTSGNQNFKIKFAFPNSKATYVSFAFAFKIN